MEICVEDVWIRNERHSDMANLPNFLQKPGSYGSRLFDVTKHCLGYLCSFDMSPTSKTESIHYSITHLIEVWFLGRNKIAYTSKDFDFRKRYTIFLELFHGSTSSIHCSVDMQGTEEVLLTRCSGKGSKYFFFRL